ncbi:PREDICTED: uncharacterized protein LOC104801943 [Tarenaya hassleriana]|uniref:uncharacterized protein LOC104801943 n=1 Tax=Tarenaya hassleriana TaxID=28532 RepID=UPI00053C872E|nr:PREDICTED: uncharacterized protein LOC104801943 [Tarenaya hassleriana]
MYLSGIIRIAGILPSSTTIVPNNLKFDSWLTRGKLLGGMPSVVANSENQAIPIVPISPSESNEDIGASSLDEDESFTEGALEDVEDLAHQASRLLSDDHNVTRSFEAARTGFDVHNAKAPRANHRAEPPLTRARA